MLQLLHMLVWGGTVQLWLLASCGGGGVRWRAKYHSAGVTLLLTRAALIRHISCSMCRLLGPVCFSSPRAARRGGGGVTVWGSCVTSWSQTVSWRLMGLSAVCAGYGKGRGGGGCR
jgi:hypothetical protein